ncbi:hypothetical protein D8M04_01825 [Oceanobacillus piezotolerans]|uniref:Uncharacterized protein n=1 Tax=Oceanobacillus piezotolerans TaxID=2448030 RepID=A0A498D9P5_9BACI|nr:hypothetical protein [Oceanobacillus piezotolerans]RLL48043.1 hypothetical protein D8M04_01825 [Oceanobacillus piezotolerans]
MEGLLDLIFENFFVILILLSGLLGLFGKNEKDKKTDKPHPKRPSPSNTTMEQKSQRKVQEPSSPIPTTISIEDQKKEQMERLASQLKTDVKASMEAINGREISNHSFDAFKGKELQRKAEQLSEEQKKLKREIGNNLTKKGLVQGIIMSEVLGPPRARKPFRTVSDERKFK